MTVEAGEGRERTALDLDDRDTQPGRVEHDLLERRAAVRDDQ
jgi:hypothetical protein